MRKVFLLLLLYGWMPIHSQAQDDAPRPDFQAAPPVTLSLFNRDIAVLRATIGTMTPEMRRADIYRKKGRGDKFSIFDELSFQEITLEEHRGVVFFLGNIVLFTYFESDLPPAEDITLEQQTQVILERLEEIRQAARDQSAPGLILMGIVQCLVATGAFGAVLWLLLKIRKRIRKFLVRRASGLKWMKFRDFDLRAFLLQGTRHLITLLITLLALGAGYIWLGYCLGRFPYTAPWAKVLGGFLASLAATIASAVVSAIPDLVMVAVILMLTRWLAKIVSHFLATMAKGHPEESFLAGDTARATRGIAVVLIWIFGFVLAFPYIPGSDSQAFKGIGVMLGLMVSLGSSGVVSQIMSGFMVLYSGALRTGEYALVGDVEGTVTEITLLSTKVLTPKNEYVTVPNALLVGKNTVNYTRLQKEGKLAELATSVTIGYDTPWRQVKAMLLLAADRTSGLRKDPPPRVLQTQLSDFYIGYELRFVPSEISRKAALLDALHQRILDVFNEFGVQITSPHFVNQPAEPQVIPPENWAPAPADEKPRPGKGRKRG